MNNSYKKFPITKEQIEDIVIDESLLQEALVTFTVEDSKIQAIFDDANMTCKVKIIGTRVPHTCEHCKFYENGWRFCNNMEVEKRLEANDYLVIAFAKDFGCIFWKGKE